MFWLSQPPGKASNQFRGQLVNPNFAESIEFSTKFSETPLRKLILLTKRLSVEIDNLLLFICKEWRRIQLSTNILEERSFLPEISNQKLQIRVYTVPFQTLSLNLQNVQKKKKKLKKNSFQVTTDAFQASIGKHASCRNRKKRTKSAKISFRWQIFDHLVTMMTNLHRFLWCWRCCPFASSVIWEDRLDALSARRATIADVTSTNWTKKGDFRRNYPLFDNCYCHIDTSEIQISGSSSVLVDIFSPLYTAQCADLYLLLLFFIPCLPILSSLQVYIYLLLPSIYMSVQAHLARVLTHPNLDLCVHIQRTLGGRLPSSLFTLKPNFFHVHFCESPPMCGPSQSRMIIFTQIWMYLSLLWLFNQLLTNSLNSQHTMCPVSTATH